MPRAPVLFVSHGAPDLALQDDLPAARALDDLGRSIGTPRAIVVVTAHWTTATAVAVTTGVAPATIHDFAGFGPELERLRYPAPGDPVLAGRIVDLLTRAGVEAQGHDRGFDHGVWVPLWRMRPDARVPVVAVSVQPRRDGAHHVAVGRALAPLRDEGVVILGSGAATHRLDALMPGRQDPPPWVSAFDSWVVERVEAGDDAGLARWHEAPEARRNHPTPEHLLPLLVAAGAGGGPGRVWHRSTTWGVLAMTHLRWDDQP